MNTTSLNIETLTPIHIGSGTDLNPNFEYLHFDDENVLTIINEEKVLDVIGEDNLSDWVSIIDKEEKLLPYLRKRRSGLSPNDVAERVIDLVEVAPGEKSTLKEQLHAGKDKSAMIPGSSLKGSIRTAILRSLILREPYFASEENNISFKRGNRRIFKDGQLQANYFGKKNRRNRNNELQLDANRDFMRMIRVTDAYFSSQTECRKLEIVNEYRSGWGFKDRESSFIECIPKGVSSTTSIQIPKQLLDLMNKKRFEKTETILRNQKLFSLTEIFNTANKCTLAVIKEELSFWDEEGNPEPIGDYMEVLEEFEKELEVLVKNEKPTACILRVGAGSGWDFMTGGWARKEDIMDDYTWNQLKTSVQKRDYRGNASFPKTRKLIVGGIPLGFVKLSLEK
jgi:CRISPR type III-A-associated RAMP protein Csm5